MGWTKVQLLHLTVFVLHATSSIFLAIITTKCGSLFLSDSFAETYSDVGYRVVTNGSCDPRNASCFYGVPQAYDVAQRGLEWNVFALLTAFEWISASFALGHLYGFGANVLCLCWNLVGVLWLMPYTTPMPLLQIGITSLSLLMATTAQYYPIGNEDGGVVMHYTEYCTSASLLFVGVLILYIPDPPSWAVIIGFTGILLCNLTGVAAHLCKLDTVEKSACLPLFDLDWRKTANHFKLYLIHSWIGMLLSVLIILYLARDSFGNGDIPWWVRLILINLLVTYTLFGLWATACYIIADRRGDEFKLWVSGRLGLGLTILSVSAKLPIAFTVFYGLLGMPGERLCI